MCRANLLPAEEKFLGVHELPLLKQIPFRGNGILAIQSDAERVHVHVMLRFDVRAAGEIKDQIIGSGLAGERHHGLVTERAVMRQRKFIAVHVVKRDHLMVTSRKHGLHHDTAACGYLVGDRYRRTLPLFSLSDLPLASQALNFIERFA